MRGVEQPRAVRRSALPLERMMWDVHVAAVETGLFQNRHHLATLPAAEARFAQAWGYTAVEFIAAGDFPSDGDSIGRTQAIILPRRLGPVPELCDRRRQDFRSVAARSCRNVAAGSAA